MGTARVVAWAPDGESFVIGTNVGGVERYDAVTGASLGSFARHVREICSLQWSPDGRTLVSADAECVRFSDVRTTTVFDELRPGWSIESARLASNVDGSAELVVGGNAGSVDESPGRVAFASIPAP
jgi:WD40 repeat protein